MTQPKKMKIKNQPALQMISDEVDSRLKKYHMFHRMAQSNCILRYDVPAMGEDGFQNFISRVPSRSSTVYQANKESGTYSHHPQLAKFKDKYCLAWSNGVVNEDDAGQRILFATSENGVTWSQHTCIAGDAHDATFGYMCSSLYSDGNKLFALGLKQETIRDASAPGMRRIDPANYCLEGYSSDEGLSWTKVFEFDKQIKMLLETPRLTTEDRLLTAASTPNGPAMLLWPDKDICRQPEIIPVSVPQGCYFPYGEGSWYQVDDGRIIVLWRDEGMSCRLWMSSSDDGGKTFTNLTMTNIPDSMSRLNAGRLSDGRFYICNNASYTLLDRMHLMLFTSQDGYMFDKVYYILNKPTTQKFKGLLKEDGYQYPSCICDNDTFMVAYSLNKEDMEVAAIELKHI